MRSILVLTLLALFGFGSTVATALPRTSKPKEIVVVGSKVKDVVRAAGFEAGEGLVQALDADVRKAITEAKRRASRNGRSSLRPHDLAPIPEFSRADQLIADRMIERLLASNGVSADAAFVDALSDKVHEILEDAMQRAGANSRGTVRPYDL